MKFLRQIFRPVYRGGGFEIRPRRWWSRTDRKDAALSAKVLATDEFAGQIARRSQDFLRDAILKGMR